MRFSGRLFHYPGFAVGHPVDDYLGTRIPIGRVYNFLKGDKTQFPALVDEAVFLCVPVPQYKGTIF
jgi:hypothetical protein